MLGKDENKKELFHLFLLANIFIPIQLNGDF